MRGDQLDFLKSHPKGIYRTSFKATLDGLKLDQKHRERFEEKLSEAHSSRDEDYIESPNDFLKMWINGHLGKTPRLPQILGGFELQLPQVETKFGSIYGQPILSDIGHSSDFGGKVLLNLHHIPTKKVLTYQTEDKRKLLEKNEFKHESIHQDPLKPEKYPLESLNSEKFGETIWSLINIKPEEIYQSLKKRGFSWKG